ncbi:hypothetical protein PG984_002542 [Apiospora sp. TS-2023a]
MSTFSNPTPTATTTPVGDAVGAGIVAATPSVARAPPSKRRKLRKGTQSCWECKRRKTRCTYATSSDAICDGCKSRVTKCISQEFEDAPGEQHGSKTSERLKHMESLLHQLLPKRQVGDRAESYTDQSKTVSTTLESPRWPPNSELTVPSTVVMDSNLEDISRSLLQVWPSNKELELILQNPIDTSTLHHGTVCMPYSEFLSRGIPSPRQMLQLPPNGAHPVLICRKLLLLGALLLGMSQHHSLMCTVVKTASKLVTSDDELLTSIEGIECLMIESMSLNNAGSLRRAWLTNRRAMTMAQMLGINRGLAAPELYLEASTMDHIYPEYMWVRLTNSDRYLSLMLGLPLGSTDNDFSTPASMRDLPDVVKFERTMGVAAGLIIQRNKVQRTDLESTMEVDKMLQEVASMMPARWWLAGSSLPPLGVTATPEEAFEESTRLYVQLAYHHLLTQLHLPYMLLSATAQSDYGYHKMTAASASRATLTRFVALRSAVEADNPVVCRGIDFMTLTAGVTLCIAHIKSRNQQRAAPGNPGATSSDSSFQSLRHQRPPDRALLERALEILEGAALRYRDVVAQKIAQLLRPLLEMEQNSALGRRSYHISASAPASNDVAVVTTPWGSSRRGRGLSSSRGIGGDDEVDDSVGGVLLSIQIPYVGTVNIRHRHSTLGASSGSGGEEELSSEPLSYPRDALSGTTFGAGSGIAVQWEPIVSSNHDPNGDNDGGGVPRSHRPPASSSTRYTGYEISTAEPANADWQAVPSYLTEFLTSPLPVAAGGRSPRVFPRAASRLAMLIITTSPTDSMNRFNSNSSNSSWCQA